MAAWRRRSGTRARGHFARAADTSKASLPTTSRRSCQRSTQRGHCCGWYPSSIVDSIPTEIITRTSYDNVRDHYINMLSRTRLVAGDHLVQIVGRSHMFIEGITDVENLTSGTPGSTRFFFCSWPDRGMVSSPSVHGPGCRGTPYRWRTDLLSWLQSGNSSLTHDDFLAAIATGARVAHFFRPDGWVVGWGWPGPADGTVVVVHGHDAIDDRLRSELATVNITSVACVNRVVTPWYLYAELLWSYREGPGQTSSMRTAAFLPDLPGWPLHRPNIPTDIAASTGPALPTGRSGRVRSC